MSNVIDIFKNKNKRNSDSIAKFNQELKKLTSNIQQQNEESKKKQRQIDNDKIVRSLKRGN